MRITFLFFCLLFFSFGNLLAADTLFVETFESGGGSFNLNTSDLGSVTNGYNDFIINNAYTGGSGSLICLGFPFSFTIANTAAQPAAIVGSPNSFYLHTISDEAVADNIFASSFQAADGVCQQGQNIFSTMNIDVPTNSHTNVNLNFWWACGGGTAIHGEVYYSTNSGTSWTQLTAPIAQYKNQTTWAQQTISLPAFSGQNTLRFGFRFVNQASSAATDPGFSIDDVVISGDLLNDVVVDSVSALTLCPGDPISVYYSAVGAFQAGNVFTAQLSDPNGSFAIPVPIGSLNSTSSGTIAATLPANAPAGTGYRIRVTSSAPALIGADNGNDISLLALPLAGTATAMQDTLCEGDSTSLLLTGQRGNIQWETSADGVNYQPLTGASSSTLGTGGIFQTTWYQAVVSTACGSQTSNSVRISLAPSAAAGTISANPDSLCEGESTLLSVNGASGNIQWQMAIGPAFQDIAGATGTTYQTGPLSPGVPNEYRVQASLGFCPDVFSVPLPVFVSSRPNADFSFQSNGVQVDFTDLSTGAQSYDWNFGDGATSTQVNPSHSYAANGNYTVTLIVTNGFGCKDTTSQTVSFMVGIRQALDLAEVRIGANPFDQSLDLSIVGLERESMEISLLNVHGQTLIREKFQISGHSTTFSLNTAAIPQGIYLVQLRAGNKQKVIRAIKQ